MRLPWLRRPGCARQGHSASFLSFSLSCLLSSLFSQYYNTHMKTSLQPLLHFSFYSLLDLFFLLLSVSLAAPQPCACSLSTLTSLCIPFNCLFSFNPKYFLSKSFNKATLVIFLFTYLQSVSLLQSTLCALSHLRLSSPLISSPPIDAECHV